MPLLPQTQRQVELPDGCEIDTRKFICGCVGWRDREQTGRVEETRELVRLKEEIDSLWGVVVVPESENTA